MVARLLQCIGVVALAFANQVHAYNARMSAVYGVAESNRVSPSQLFARDVDILESASTPYMNLLVDAPGRVFVTYVDNPTAAAQGIYSEIKVSGSSSAVVGNITFEPSTVFPEEIQIKVEKSQPNLESLLIEVQLYKKNVLKRVRMKGTGDLVIRENVLHAPPKRAEGDTSGLGSIVEIEYDDGNIFVYDPTAEFTTEFFDIKVMGEGNASIQVELAKLNSTVGDLDVTLHDKGNVALFVDQLGPMGVWYTSNASEAHSGLCVSTKSSVNATSTNSEKDIYKPTSIMLPSGASCVKRPLPDRVPALIRLPTVLRKGSDYAPAAPAAANAATPAPGAKSAAIATPWSAVVAVCGLLATLLTVF